MESVINYIEMLIENQMNNFLKENPICKSEKSKKKLYNLTLSKIKPNYNNMTDYQLLVILSGTRAQLEGDINEALKKAVEEYMDMQREISI